MTCQHPKSARYSEAALERYNDQCRRDGTPELCATKTTDGLFRYWIDEAISLELQEIAGRA